ncbi:MAG: HD domain-containing protein [Bacteroidales bacterium]|jgi:guanosine-3',5'-bis(diphosphate) 3'-pyrophosphohydrolase|nr:HD domain-containing protein [Bacteroidales bacterium]
MNKQIIKQGNTFNLRLIFSALEYAAVKHQFQKRKGAAGIPYINHLIEVGNILIQKLEKPSDELLVAAILHDTIEDTDARQEEIQKIFGRKVSNIVMEVTDNMNLPSSVRKKNQIEKAKKLSYEARCIKIADKTCNIRDILFTRVSWSKKRKIKYVLWANKVIDEIRDTDPNLIHEFDQAVKQSKEILKMKD